MSKKNNTIELEYNPSRICYAIGKIGYSPESAICDIVDNSVSAKAKNINIILKRKQDVAESRKNSLEEFIIIDDGCGMNLNGIKNALTLGSSNENYSEDTLSKFGLGLKSAGFSQGKKIEIVSFTNPSSKKKLVLDIDLIEQLNQYHAVEEELNNNDQELINTYLANSLSGTIVRISKIHADNHPSLKTTRDKLKNLLGVTYYYFIEENKLKISLDEDVIKAIDVLFTKEAKDPLDKTKWDGLKVCWIMKKKSIFIDDESKASIEIEVTQLPHPPSIEANNDGEVNRNEIRSKYLISQNNYGFYVYRNKRLISWAERFDDIIPKDQDYFSFRGRILINSSADEALNIDVKKSRVLLSEYAYDAISDVVREPKMMSRDSWRNRTQKLRRIAGEEPEKISEENINKITLPDLLPKDADDEGSLQEIKRRKEQYAKKNPLKLEEKRSLKQVNFVDYIEDNTLWDVAFDSDLGTIVRINRHHRFIKEINRINEEAPYATTAMHIMFYCLARAEAHTITNFKDSNEEILEKTLLYFREAISSFLSEATKDSLEKL